MVWLFWVWDSPLVFSQIPAKKFTKYEVGVTIGMPGLIQPVISGYSRSRFGWRISGMVTPNVKGFQGNLLFRLVDRKGVSWNAGVAAGHSKISYDSRQTWSYGGLTTSLNLYGFFVETGLTWGRGDFSNPQLIGQIGYVYRFRK